MTPAMLARQATGLSVEEAARRAHICTAYLRTIERRGGASYGLAIRLARLYGCSANLFLYHSQGSETPQPRTAQGRKRRRLKAP